MGPCNGPEDFSLTVDTLFCRGPSQERRLRKEWEPFIDFVIVTGYRNGGSPVADRDYNERVAGAAR
eukprot:15484490-Alexandrium_andersonii.AAC.1